MQKQGMTFSHYFVTDSLCCSSRASIFTGKYPHNTTVFTNGGDAGGYPQFERAGNASQTFALVLEPAGYKASMMGNYLNGYVPKRDQKDRGWTGWNVAGAEGYNEYGYELNNDGVVTSYGSANDDYLTDVLSDIGSAFLQRWAGGPFMLEAATFAPHAPHTPAPRKIGQFNVKLPRSSDNPAFATANTHPPNWLAERAALSDAQIAGLDKGYNLRVEAVQAVDDMIGAFMTQLSNSGVDPLTYVFFSSDNGYHMGDHNLMAGKQTAFDHDINVPLIVIGPGVPAGVTVDKIVQSIDLCPTFADIAGSVPPPTADGRSLLPLMLGQRVSDWRNVALIEHHGQYRSVAYTVAGPAFPQHNRCHSKLQRCGDVLERAEDVGVVDQRSYAPLAAVGDESAVGDEDAVAQSRADWPELMPSSRSVVAWSAGGNG